MAIIKTRARGLKLDDTFAFTGSVSGAGGGKVAQVVQAICSGGDTSTTSSTLQSSNVTVTITPTASDSKVLVMMNFGGSSGADQNKL